jgi:CRP/FNR family transcriptional regulator, cyclic AMP receptor protein
MPVTSNASDGWDLATLPLFAGISEAEIAEIAGLATLLDYPTGGTIFAESEPGDALYAVLRGRVEIRCRDRRGHEQTLATLEPGAILGETALLIDEPRSVSAVTVAGTTVLQLTKETFMALLLQGHRAAQQLLYNVARGVASRLGEVNRHLTRLLADQNVTKVVPREDELDELDELKRKLFTEWKF